MIDPFLINRYRGYVDLAHELVRIELVLKGKELEFTPLEAPTEQFSDN
jgi:hypothetical protein